MKQFQERFLLQTPDEQLTLIIDSMVEVNLHKIHWVQRNIGLGELLDDKALRPVPIPNQRDSVILIARDSSGLVQLWLSVNFSYINMQ